MLFLKGQDSKQKESSCPKNRSILPATILSLRLIKLATETKETGFSGACIITWF